MHLVSAHGAVTAAGNAHADGLLAPGVCVPSELPVKLSWAHQTTTRTASAGAGSSTGRCNLWLATSTGDVRRPIVHEPAASLEQVPNACRPPRPCSGPHIDAAALSYQSPKAKGKREIEDRLVEQVVSDHDPIFLRTNEAILNADWYILSARRADRLVRECLYERVFALSVPSFTRAYRGAEVDMHFSLSADPTPLRDFLHTFRESGHPVVVSKLERGDY